MCQKNEKKQDGHGAKCGKYHHMADTHDSFIFRFHSVTTLNQRNNFRIKNYYRFYFGPVNIISILQDQYTFVYDAVLEATLVGDTVIPAHAFQETYSRLKEKDGTSNKTMLNKQYEV